MKICDWSVEKNCVYLQCQLTNHKFINLGAK